MKKLFIYYSYTGSGDAVAKYLAEKEFDIRKVIRKKPMPKSFVLGMLYGGFLAGTKHKDEIEDIDFDVSAYDEVFIGSPIWNGRFSGPLNTILSKLGLKDKKVTIVFCAGSGEGKPAAKRIEKEYPDFKYVFLKEPKKYPEELKKLDELFK